MWDVIIERRSGRQSLIGRFKTMVIELGTFMSREITWKVSQIEWDVSKAFHLSAGFVGILAIGELTNFQTTVQPNRVITVKKIAWLIENISALAPNSHGPTICPESRKIDKKVVARAITSGKIL